MTDIDRIVLLIERFDSAGSSCSEVRAVNQDAVARLDMPDDAAVGRLDERLDVLLRDHSDEVGTYVERHMHFLAGNAAAFLDELEHRLWVKRVVDDIAELAHMFKVNPPAADDVDRDVGLDGT